MISRWPVAADMVPMFFDLLKDWSGVPANIVPASIAPSTVACLVPKALTMLCAPRANCTFIATGT